MIDIETAKPKAKQILSNIKDIEEFYMGDKVFSPEKYREINEELSVGAVLLIGKRRYKTDSSGKKLYWKGLDNREYDMGLVHETNIKRDYPGFNARRSRALAGDLVQNNEVISKTNGNGSISIVTMRDGSTGLGPNYRIALRNAALKMHLKSSFNYASLSSIWNTILGYA